MTSCCQRSPAGGHPAFGADDNWSAGTPTVPLGAVVSLIGRDATSGCRDAVGILTRAKRPGRIQLL